MQLAVIFEPTLSNVIAVVHVRNHDIPDARIGLRLCKAHRLSDSAHDQHHAGGAGDEKKFALVAVHRFRSLQQDYPRAGTALPGCGMPRKPSLQN